MTTISYLNVSSAAELSADIKAIDLASQADGGNGTHYLITLQAGATLTESADISAINLAGNDTLTINGQGAVLNGAGAYRGLFAYSGTTTIENLTIENAVARAARAAPAAAAAGARARRRPVRRNNSAGGAPANVTLDNVVFNGDLAVGGAGGGSRAAAVAAAAAAAARRRRRRQLACGGGGGGGVGSSGFGGAGLGSRRRRIDSGAAAGAAARRRRRRGGGGGGGWQRRRRRRRRRAAAAARRRRRRLRRRRRRRLRRSAASAASAAAGAAAVTEAGDGGFGGGGGGGLRRPSAAARRRAAAAGSAPAATFSSWPAPRSPSWAAASGRDRHRRLAAARRRRRNGQAFGGGLFLQGNETITFAPANGTIETISGVIADQTGSGGTGANAGAGSLCSTAPARSISTAANTFTGGVTIDSGVLELANAKAAGSGAIHFASTSGEIEYAAGASLANTISGFGGSDEIDFAKVAFATGDHAVDNAGKVSIETSAGATVATFNVSGTYTSANFTSARTRPATFSSPTPPRPQLPPPSDGARQPSRSSWTVRFAVCGAALGRRPATCLRSIPGRARVGRRDRPRRFRLPP